MIRHHQVTTIEAINPEMLTYAVNQWLTASQADVLSISYGVDQGKYSALVHYVVHGPIPRQEKAS